MALALIVAAGRGERLGADSPKALVELAGRSLLQWSVDLMLGVDVVDRVVVALPSGVPAPAGTLGVEGGAVRSESVRLALAAAGPGEPAVAAGPGEPAVAADLGEPADPWNPADVVIVHDAARPLASAELVRRVLAVLDGEDGADLDAAIAAVPVVDTVKRVGDGVVVETLDRSCLWAVQTPQVFRRAALERALDVPAEILAQATDDAWLVERLGGRVAVVPADGENLKITTPLDLALAELLLARRE
jgi:2-C-methyl-D-erythritol 4-phosphate cytidylyltransferase